MTATASPPDAGDDGDLPLDGIRIVDFSRLLPGPWSTQMLADLGAQVVKVEQPGLGDPSRHNPPRYRTQSAYFVGVNGNKHFIALQLGTVAGAAVARRLLGWADVVVESFRVGVASRLGIDYAAARSANPAVIHCSITGYGQDGPLAHIAGHDLAIQATSGLLGVGSGAMPAFLAADYAGAATATIGILAALRRRDRTGRGCHLDIAMHDSLFAMGNIALGSGLAKQGGGSGEPQLEVWGGNPRYDLYPTRDGRQVAVCLLEPRLWALFCQELGRPDLISGEERPEHRHTPHGQRSQLYRDAIAAYCLAHDRDDIAARMEAQSIPVVAVLSPEEAVTSVNAAGRDLIDTVAHPTDGDVPVLRNPLHRAGLTRSGSRAAQPLGADTDEVLGWLGFSEAERQRLRADGTVVRPEPGTAPAPPAAPAKASDSGG